MSDFDLVVTGRIVDANRVIERGFVAIRDGAVIQVGEGRGPAANERHDFGDAYVMPGGIDAQVHSRSQKNQEDFIWSTRTAAAGGVTTIVDMPYDDGDLICNADRLTAKAESASEQARVDFALYGTIMPSEGPARIAEMVKAGAAAFKFSTFETHPTRFPRISSPLLYEAFREIARAGLIAGVHNENDEAVRFYSERVQQLGLTDYTAHEKSRPAITETLAIAEVYEIAQASGCDAHIVHCSVGRGYELSSAYQKQGVNATIEACIHYLVLSEDDDVSRLVGKAKINPPVRRRAEREAIWHHLAAGNVTVVSTDHVSWSEDRKSDPDMLKNASGVPGLEVLYSLLFNGLLKRELPLTHAARLLAANPARLFRINHLKGALEPGRDADIVVMGHKPGKYDPSASGHCYVNWSPYEGIELAWRPVATFLRGQMVFDGTDVLAQPGNGRFVRPPLGM